MSSWPLVDPHQRSLALRRCLPALRANFGARIPDVAQWAEALVVPLACRLADLPRAGGKAPIVGVSGGQGAGKSTLVAAVALVLREAFDGRVAVLSLDDVYLTHAERAGLGRQVHPLLATRGVPGTHDVPLALRTLDALAQSAPGDHVDVPRFDKATDDRKPELDRVVGPIDIVIFEGWCVGLPPPPPSTLGEPVNDLERTQDADGSWRRGVVAALDGPYRALWERLDLLVALIVPDLDAVRRWRGEAEAEVLSRATTTKPSRPVKDVTAFVAHYERWTRWGAEALPTVADVTVWLDDQHHPVRVEG